LERETRLGEERRDGAADTPDDGRDREKVGMLAEWSIGM
jgi:hypothetical protein